MMFGPTLPMLLLALPVLASVIVVLAGFFSLLSFDTPRGIALGPTGEIYVADLAADRISRVDRTNGALTTFATNIDTPYGMEWLAGGPAAFADSLLVASSGERIVVATRGQTALAAAYLRNTPIDLTVAAGTLYIVTSPSANNRGRIYKVGGF
jgi:glucose/arabinose dehydrogenase